MGIINRGSLSDLQGAVRLAVDAAVGVTDVVEKMHHTIQLRQAPLGSSRAGNTSGLTGFVYRSIRGTTRLVGKGLDAGISPVMSLLPESASNSTRDALVAAINGVYGDHLLETGNPLTTKMHFRYQGRELEPGQLETLPGKNARVLLFIHGLCLNDRHWTRDGVNHGETLAKDLGYTPIYLRYNTGRPVADNGRDLASLLERLVTDQQNVFSELVIAGHSMGGLVARSACHYGELASHQWMKYLGKFVSIGTPHLGAPLERGGNWINYAMDMSPYAAPFTRIAKKRSAGITDLRHGSITDEAKDFVPLPAGVECYAIAATLAKRSTRLHERLIGDGLVPIDSALGRGRDPSRSLQIPESHQRLEFETGHIEILGKPEIYRQLRDWLQ